MMDAQEIHVNVEDEDSQNRTSSVQRRLAMMIIAVPHSQRRRSLSLILLDDLLQKDQSVLSTNNDERMLKNSFQLSDRSK